MISENIPAGAIDIIKTLKNKGFQAWLVGGCIRDLLLKRPVEEWDITTSAKPMEVSQLFRKVIPTGIAFGTVLVILPDGEYEVTTFRSDARYEDGRHPTQVVFTGDLHQDLSRRDFTINALAFDPETSQLIDDFNGQDDLKKKIIRTVGNPLDRFSEDGLRSVRACRFAAVLEFEIDKATFAAIPQTLATTKKVALERIHDELVKILSASKPSLGLDLMRQSGILNLFLPELVACLQVEQPPQFHKYDVYWHSLYASDAAPRENLIVRLAALLHDIGKPACKVDNTFYNHERVSAELAEKIMERLRFSSDEVKKVGNLIKNHMFEYSSDWSDAAVRRYLRRIGGTQNVNDLFTLRRSDTEAMVKFDQGDYLLELQKRIDKIIAEENALDVTDLKVNGEDVMRVLNIAPGPIVGRVLSFLLEKVLDDPKLNERDILLALINTYE